MNKKEFDKDKFKQKCKDIEKEFDKDKFKQNILK